MKLILRLASTDVSMHRSVLSSDTQIHKYRGPCPPYVLQQMLSDSRLQSMMVNF